ncbi:hypothetical protein [Stenotrophomonas sp. S41]|uniref:hypothetical protein n=1 Tax=Stenotrophomonas sp. S41 TaxID=2767464 RepID=UPI00190B976E|nr:hypothetical protein [Stenotrophomonas sp. S41]MBK0012758.1 hypothetical protein [Stenotrophomonas sp. S41]
MALILYVKPYTGIRHDSTLYLVQALHVLNPGIFGRDLFFLAGSQADFTIFPQLVALLLKVVEPGPAFLVHSMLGRVAFYAASAYLIVGIFPAKWRWPAAFALIIMPTGYGAFSMFSYAEPFFTARPVSEALSLLALGLLVRNRTWSSILVFALAGALHPLQGLAAVIVAWCWLVQRDRRWLWSLWLVIPVALLGWLKVGPLEGLFRSIDAEWREMIIGLSDQVYLGKWTPRDWCIVLTDVYLLTLLAAKVQLGGAAPKLARSALWAVAIGLACSFVLSDVLQLILPTGLQLWRVLWLAHWLAVASAPMLIWESWKDPQRGTIPALLLFLIALIGASVPYSTLPWAVLGLIPLHMAWPHVKAKTGAGIRRLLVVALLAAMLIAVTRYELKALHIFAMLDHNYELMRVDVVMLAYPLILLTLVAAAVFCFRRANRFGQALFGALSLVAVAGALTVWDSRSPWTQVQESATGTDVFGYDVPEAATVFWYASEASPLGPWLVLRRANYFSPYQLSGQMFNRDTPFIGRELKIQIDPVMVQAEICDFVTRSDSRAAPCRVSTIGLESLCTAHGRLQPPDYFVLPFDQLEHVRGKWVVRHPATGEVILNQYLYKCTDWASGLKEADSKEQG